MASNNRVNARSAEFTTDATGALDNSFTEIIPAGEVRSFLRLFNQSGTCYVHFGNEVPTTDNSYLMLANTRLEIDVGLLGSVKARTSTGTGKLYAVYA